jgi:hypothetical protein
MRLDASYNLCSKLGSKLIFWRNYSSFSFARPFYDFDCIFPSDLFFFKVEPDKIYAYRKFPYKPLRRHPRRPSGALGPTTKLEHGNSVSFQTLSTWTGLLSASCPPKGTSLKCMSVSCDHNWNDSDTKRCPESSSRAVRGSPPQESSVHRRRW